jgi:hypothetical protein
MDKLAVQNKVTDFLWGYRVDGIASISTPSYGIPKWRIFENRRIDKALREEEISYLKSDEYKQQCVHEYLSSLSREHPRNNKGQFIKSSKPVEVK